MEMHVMARDRESIEGLGQAVYGQGMKAEPGRPESSRFTSLRMETVLADVHVSGDKSWSSVNQAFPGN